MRPLKDLPADLRAVILEMAETPRGFLIGELFARCNITQARAYRALARMRDDGLIACTWVGQGSRWTLAEKMPALRDRLQREYVEKKRKRKAEYFQRKKRGIAPEAQPVNMPKSAASVWEWGR